MSVFTYVGLVVGIGFILKLGVLRKRNRQLKDRERLSYHSIQIKIAWMTGSSLFLFVVLAKVLGWIRLNDILHVLLAYLFLFIGELIYHYVYFYRMKKAIQPDF
ncbi:hypothetical protein SAMN05421663_105127 [Terribacillus halophilus]|uniref:Uncharacterized protein n=1 Tax=Terribacillus halophilus TaxID=361279 RepID=A0A1G6QKX6_9BACI|nr:hypothetical protein SAMN05421663_105127 [Terribacillus halophilus]